MEKIFTARDCLSRAEIHHYLSGKLPEDQRFKVENHLLDCPLCDAAVEGFEQMDQDAENTLDELYEDINVRLGERTEAAAVRKMFPWNRIAAAILLLITAGAAWLYYQNSNQEQDYLAYFEDATATSTVRGRDSDLLTEDLLSGVRLYEKENFQGSLSFFEDYLKAQESPVASYYAGLSALKTGELGLAEEYLKVARMNKEELYESATWNLAKVYISRRERAKASQLLQDLSKIEGGFYTEKATELLQRLQ